MHCEINNRKTENAILYKNRRFNYILFIAFVFAFTVFFSSVSLCGINYYGMADTTAHAASFSFTYNTSANSNKILIFSAAFKGYVKITSVQYAGQNFTYVTGTANSIVAYPIEGEIWYLQNPAAGPNNITVTVNAVAYSAAGVIEYDGVSSIGANGVSNNAGTTSRALTTTVSTTQAGSIISGIFAERYNAAMTFSSITNERWNIQNTASYIRGAGHDITCTAAGPYNVTYYSNRISSGCVMMEMELQAASTPTNTPVFSLTNTPTYTWSPAESPSPSVTVTPSDTPTATSTTSTTLTVTASAMPSLTMTGSVTDTMTNTPTHTPTLTNTCACTYSVTITSTSTAILTGTSTESPENTVTETSIATWTVTSTATPSLTVTSTASDTMTNTPTRTPTLTNTCACTGSVTITSTSTATLTGTSTESPENTFTETSIATWTDTSTATPSPTVTSTASDTMTNTPTRTPTLTDTCACTGSVTITITGTATLTETSTIAYTWTPTRFSSPSSTITSTAVFSYTVTRTITNTESPVNTSTETSTPIMTSTFKATPTLTQTFIMTLTPVQGNYTVQIVIYDSTGQVVRTLASTKDTDIVHNFSFSKTPFIADGTSILDIIDMNGNIIGGWNGRDDNGNMVFPGTYRVKVTTNNQYFVIKDIAVVAEDPLAGAVVQVRYSKASTGFFIGAAADWERVKIYNIKGELIKTLYPEGANSAEWDMTTAKGAKASHGIYIAVIELKNKTTGNSLHKLAKIAVH